MLTDLEEEVLSEIRPSAREENERRAVVERVIHRIRELLSASGMRDADPLLVGSVAKGTHLAGADTDIFILFPVETERERMEQVGLSVGKAALSRPTLKYAEHPYVRGFAGRYSVDIVPCFAVTDPMHRKSAVDRTPFQSRFVNEHMKAWQKDHVRLLKQFFKGTGTYGAETKVQGFSGYLCELLILNYGEFKETMSAIAEWRKGQKVGEIYPETRCSNASLCIADPVDSERNVAAALGQEAFGTAVIAAREYLKDAGRRFFFPGKRRLPRLSSLESVWSDRGHGLLLFTMSRPDIVEDNLYPQIRKATRNLSALLERYGFSVCRYVFEANDKIRILFELNERQHPSWWIMEGPECWSGTASEFIDKHRSKGAVIFQEEGKLYAHEKRPFTEPSALVSVKLRELSLGADLDLLKDSVELAEDKAVFSRENQQLIASLLHPSFPWES
ncbi:MAG: CCA tRNA nucleotidyltransferase [Methanomassiliicoccales archaeon]